MMLDLPTLLDMVRRTLTNPREGANEVLSLGLPRNVLWLAVAALAVLTTLVMALNAILEIAVNGVPEVPVPSPGTPSIQIPSIGPFVLALVVWASIALTVVAVHVIGRMFGGKGEFDESLALVAWLQFIVLGPALLNAVLGPVSPLLGGVITLAALALNLWLLTQFVAVIHGFTSIGTVFVMVLVSGFAVGSALIILLSVLGLATGVIEPPQPGTLQ